MSRLKVLLCVVTMLMGGFLLVQAAPKSPPPVPPQTAKTPVSKPRTISLPEATAPTAGQLAILDKNGQTVGLCPLRHTDVQADVAGFVARVTVQQSFRNPSSSPVEAVYTFPLPDDAAVDDMTMKIGQRVVKGQIKRREEARQIYEAAKSSGQAAALLDQERPNIFTQAVANLMPGEDVVISISYVNLLRYDEGQYEFVFPTVVGPRFTPTGGYSVPGQRGAPSDPPNTPSGTNAVVTDADKITPPITPPETRAGHDLSIAVNVDAGVSLGTLSSPLHPINVERLGSSRARIRLRDQATLPNKDFTLRFKVAGEQLQTGMVAYAPCDGDGYFTLILQPPAAPPPSVIAPKEMVFVIDQTGSQAGLPIAKAKATMRYCITHLNPGDTFQLIGFNTEVYPCFEQPVAATPENIAKAEKFLEPLEGGGGTDILKSVDYALKMPDDPARPRIVCYMTDGYVGNDMQIIDFIGKNRGRARMFPFGVGNSVNRFLIDGMAREGRGVAEYVTLQEPGEAAAQRFYRRVANPLLLDVKVDWQGLPVQDVYPKHIPDVFTSGPIILKGRYTKAGEGHIILRGLLHGKEWSQKVRVVFPAVQKQGGEAMPTVWAREKMADLYAQDWMGMQSRQPDTNIKEQIVALALEYRLMSQFTSFVAVEERVVNVGGQQRRLDVPVEMPEGVSYEGIFGTEQERVTGVGGPVRLRGSIPMLGNLYRSTSPPSRTQLPSAPAAGTSGVVTNRAPGGVQVGAADRVTALENRVPAPPRLTITPSILHRSGSATVIGQGLLYDGNGSNAAANRDIAKGSEAGQKRLAAMKPQERLALLQTVKLDELLHGLAELVKKEGQNGTLHKPGKPDVEKGRVTVQIWLNALPPDGLQKLKALGFEVAATLTPNKLLLGTLPVERLNGILELPFVRLVEPPKFKSQG